MSVKGPFLYQEAEEGHVQAQVPRMLNNVREQGWQEEVLPRNWSSLCDKNMSNRILEEVAPGETKAICKKRLNMSCMQRAG